MPRKAKFNISSISTAKTFPKLPGAITFPEKSTHWRGSGLLKFLGILEGAELCAEES